MKRKLFTTLGQPDYKFLALLSILILFGLVILTSASSVVAFSRYNNSYYLLVKQLLIGLVPGVIIGYLLSRWPYQKIKPLAHWLLLGAIILCWAVFIPGLGMEYGGARRWLVVAGFSFQPSELLKLAMIIYLAAWFESKSETVMKQARETFLPFLIILGIGLVTILAQHDLGTTMVLAVIGVGIYLVAGANVFHMAGLGVMGIGALWLAIKLEPYRMDRFNVFMHPELDPQGIGYHINQALLAVGTGGFMGLGLGYSRQKYQYLPEVTGDSIFAIMAEEIGFVFLLIFLAIVYLFIQQGLKIASLAPDKFGKYLAVGMMLWYGGQTSINIASMLNIFPLTGVPLPFVSYGGSALMCILAGMGIVVNISRQMKKIS